MILVSLGTQEFSFNRLLEEIDSLIEKKVIVEEVVAQIGYSTYVPKHFRSEKFIDFQTFDELLNRCNILITHGGTGTIVGALKKKNAKIIAVPRLKKHNEHVDDHQTEIINHFSDSQMIVGIQDVSQLEEAIKRINEFKPKEFVSGNDKIVGLINHFIESNVVK
ncbi:PssE/Cps14G family polysaccharide biosynthesis glycosyltransferase [Paenibacillus xylaniclasticus]|uniref:PssE/Cps14G family polysaccharide biosynthesis glycosyltransferase n=1 Tax=Paenibacillus xylaniclasticus TaxID=588083 RepID=UPI000FDA48CD|nr:MULTISPECIES: PssE/Cps14G family polysaccharide biosynthesis glycosyltransferase [Paenibacillus]GFN32765.1 multidrug MFS transporter [Paenibacillus curdlanolyticus]